MGVKALLLLFCAAVARCGEDSPAEVSPTQLLIALRQRIAERASQLPRYMCTETVERRIMQWDPFARGHPPSSCVEAVEGHHGHSKLELASKDRLRFDVAIAHDGEIYSWVGAAQFGDNSMRDLVKRGATSTGAFGSFLRAIFVSDSAAFAFKGLTKSKGRTVFEYTFHVPLSRSSYIVGTDTVNRLTAFGGSFSVDSKTLDLLQLQVTTDPLPPDFGICETTTTLNYSPVRMNSIEFFLPSESMLQILNSNGTLSENRTVFTGCHQFTGESKLIIDDRGGDNAPIQQAAAAPVVLPPHLKLPIVLAQNIDLTTAAAGDPILGKLKAAITNRQVTLPAGTEFHGRLFEAIYRYGAFVNLEVGMRWESMTVNGFTQPVELVLRNAGALTVKGTPVHSRAVDAGLDGPTADRTVGLFVFSDVGRNFRIPAGFESEWTTVSK